MRTPAWIPSLFIALSFLCACTSQQLKTAGKQVGMSTAALAAEVFLGIEQPTPEEERAERIMEDFRQRQHAQRVAAMTAEYEEFVRTKGKPALPESDPVPVVIDTDRESILE